MRQRRFCVAGTGGIPQSLSSRVGIWTSRDDYTNRHLCAMLLFARLIVTATPARCLVGNIFIRAAHHGKRDGTGDFVMAWFAHGV